MPRTGLSALHSVSKKMHHEFLVFPCDPGSSSSDLGWVIFTYLRSSQKQKKKRNFPRCVSFETECMSYGSLRAQDKAFFIPWESFFIAAYLHRKLSFLQRSFLPSGNSHQTDVTVFILSGIVTPT